SYGCGLSELTTDLITTRFLCTATQKAPMIYLSTPCNTPGRNTSQFATTLLKNKNPDPKEKEIVRFSAVILNNEKRSLFSQFNMSRANSQAEIVSEEHLVPHANRLVIKKNNQRVASYSHITDTMLRFFVEILRHHKLYKPVSLTATMPTPDPNNTYTKPPSEIQILEFIKTLGYDEDPKTKMTVISKMVTTRLHQSWRAILSVLNRLDGGWDEICDDGIRLWLTQSTLQNSKANNSYMAKKKESAKDKIVDEPEEQHVSPVKSGRGKGFMCYGDQVVNVPTSLKRDCWD
ncbi:hypothetical protein Tco_0673717, partial [Tanacetum coccineum]